MERQIATGLNFREFQLGLKYESFYGVGISDCNDNMALFM